MGKIIQINKTLVILIGLAVAAPLAAASTQVSGGWSAGVGAGRSASSSPGTAVYPQKIRKLPAISHNLRIGMWNDEVMLLQQKLQDLGYFPKDIKPSKYFGPITKKAVADFQKSKKLPATGYVGLSTRKALERFGAVPPVSITFEKVTAPELRYKLIDRFGNMLYCDPDYYPVGRGDEKELAVKIFPEIKKAAGEFQAILKHTNLAGVSNLSDEQKLTVYREHKRLRRVLLESSGNKYKFNIFVSSNQPGYEDKLGIRVEGFIDQQGTIAVVSKSEPTLLMCPICLAVNTSIDTPLGPIAAQNLKKGMVVWTKDNSGNRRKGVIIDTARTPVPDDHKITHIILDDGRELLASPGHPTADGKPVGNLSLGDRFDGSRIKLTERILYGEGATYDILPSGETGIYWANGIPLKSTLFPNAGN